MDRAQRVDEKNGVICLVMFTPGFIVIKMSKNGSFFVFSTDYSSFFDISSLKSLFNFKVH